MRRFEDDPAARARAARSADLGAGARTGAQTGAGHDGPGHVPPAAAAVLHLQRTAGNAAVVQLLANGEDPHGLQLLASGGGAPLPTETRRHMETAFSTDFSSVRVHTGGDADRSARSLGAHAYTAGEDLVFAAGQYDPTSGAGQRTLAHELTHVVQQRSGPVDGTPNADGVKVSDPSDRFEAAAEASADRIMAGRTAEGAPLAGAEEVEG